MDYRSLLQPRTARVMQDASFLRRCGSFLIDMLLLDLLITAPFTPIFARFLGADLMSITYSGAELAAVIALFLIIYAYYVLFEYLLGQTPGMMLMNTQVTGEREVPRLLLRNSFMLPFFPFILFWVIEPIAILFWRRSVLEHLTKTRTIYQRTILI